MARSTTGNKKPMKFAAKRTSSALKKTTRKGAYAPARKSNFQKRRQPFVETKSQTDQLVALKAGVIDGTPKDTIRLATEPLTISNGTAGGGGTPADPQELTILPIYAFSNMNKGLEGSDMIGNSVYSRYLKSKLEFELPYGALQIKHPCDIYLIHGFITQKIGANFHTTPSVTGLTRANFQTHVEEQLTEYFNQRSDKLSYIPKETNNIKIIGRRKLKVNNNANLGVNPITISTGTTIQSTGARPVINMTCNWKMKRKTHYALGATSAAVNNLEHNYPNYGWIPFMAIYNPTAVDFLSSVTYPGSTPGSNNPPELVVRYNSIHYYSDS